MIEASKKSADYKVNRMYKDTLFRRLFGDERSKRNTVSLYNALGGHCEDPDDLIFTTVEGVIYMGRKNDVSFLVDGELMLWEHQSTRNPNMPLRGLIHLAQLYSKYLDLFGLSAYSSRRISIPSPKYYVFYAGPAVAPDREVLRLSDMFDHQQDEACVELIATVININEGHNAELHEACEALAGYSHFVALARAYHSHNYSREEAVYYAVQQCIEEGVLEDFLKQNQSEVITLFLEEWDEEKYRDLLRRESEEDGYAAGLEAGKKAGMEVGHAEGRAEGRAEGQSQTRDAFLTRAAEQVRAKSLTLDDAANIFGFDKEELAAKVESL